MLFPGEEDKVDDCPEPMEEVLVIQDLEEPSRECRGDCILLSECDIGGGYSRHASNLGLPF